MLRELRIENLLLIERAELRLGEGLNAITGETGAGKTVLAHSLDLLMGGKARPQIVRPGAEEAWVEGVFDLPEGMLEEPEMAELAERLPQGADEVVLGRRVSASPAPSTWRRGGATGRRTAIAPGSRPSWRSCASGTARASATWTSAATSSPRSRRSRRIPPRRRSCPPSASACATPRACAKRRRGPGRA